MNSMQPVSTSQQSQHRYACARCRLRKVKCDKVIPTCVYCLEAGVQCTYLARRARNSQKLLKTSGGRRQLLPSERGAHEIGDNIRDEAQSDGEDEDVVIPREMQDCKFEARSRQADRWKLFIAQGKSRYINSEKAKLVSNLESALAESTVIDEGSRSNPSDLLHSNITLNGSSLLGVSCVRTSLRTYHPSSELMGVLWDYYVCNVDVLIKILYKPAMKGLIERASTDLETLNPSTEAFLFAIWLATVTAMKTEECVQLLKAERSTLLTKYRYALEQALAQAGWMATQELLVLQALGLYISFVPRNNSRSLWMISGIALGIAQAMGMHSDSDSFCLNNIETEVRRRVWWSLCQLDVLLSEDCGLEPHVPWAMDTKLPSHINDSDLSEGGTEIIALATEFTEMTLSRVKIEMAETRLKVKRSQYGESPLSISAVEALIDQQIQRYKDTYLIYLDESSHLGHLCHLGVRIIIARLWKLKYDISQQSKDVEHNKLNEGLMLYNADILEITHQFPERSGQFGWFFRCKHTQWHAMAYLLIELCKAPQGPAADRAWAVLDVVFDNTNDDFAATKPIGVQKKTTKSVLWPHMLKLYARARYLRNDARQTYNLLGDSLSTLDSGYDTTTTTPTEAHLQPAPYEGLLGDPFLGSGVEDGENMSWEQLDTWLQSFQSDLLTQYESTDAQTYEYTGAFGWF